jgi:S1-C subfamily serine protease
MNVKAIAVAVALCAFFAHNAKSAWPFGASFDLPALARKTRPSVVLIVVYDSAGRPTATGTGFLISQDGILATNAHVIKAGTGAVAKTEDGRVLRVVGVMGSDMKNDVVLLKIEGTNLPYLVLGKSASLSVGEKVAIVGSPLGLEGTVSDGIVSAFRTDEGGRRLIQVTAAISHGSSGSPVINAAGEVIGIATLELSGGQSLNFAIPIEAVKKIPRRKIATSLEVEADELRDAGKREDPDYKLFQKAYKARDSEKAVESLNAYIARNADNADAYSDPGFIYVQMQRYDDALVATKKAIELYPGKTFALENLGDVYMSLNKFDDALVAYKRVIELDQNGAGDGVGILTADAWHNIWAIYTARGQRTEAAAAKEQEHRAEQKQEELSARRNKGF